MILATQGNNRFPYNPKLKERAKELRKNMTELEKRLWFGYLQGRQKLPSALQSEGLPPTPSSEGEKDIKDTLLGNNGKNISSGEELRNPPRMRGKATKEQGEFRIYRQRPIHNFIVDFYIPKLKLVIEIDGENHFTEEGVEYDTERSAILEGLGLRVVRFTNNEIMTNFEGVCEYLENIFLKA